MGEGPCRTWGLPWFLHQVKPDRGDGRNRRWLGGQEGEEDLPQTHVGAGDEDDEHREEWKMKAWWFLNFLWYFSLAMAHSLKILVPDQGWKLVPALSPNPWLSKFHEGCILKETTNIPPTRVIERL